MSIQDQPVAVDDILVSLILVLAIAERLLDNQVYYMTLSANHWSYPVDVILNDCVECFDMILPC